MSRSLHCFFLNILLFLVDVSIHDAIYSIASSNLLHFILDDMHSDFPVSMSLALYNCDEVSKIKHAL